MTGLNNKNNKSLFAQNWTQIDNDPIKSLDGLGLGQLTSM